VPSNALCRRFDFDLSRTTRFRICETITSSSNSSLTGAHAAGAGGHRGDPGLRHRRRGHGGSSRGRQWDPLRIVIDIRGTGCTGYELAAELRATHDIYLELATHATLVPVLGLGQPVEPLERFAHEFAETVRHMARPGEGPALALPPASLEHQMVVPIRDAFLGEGETVAVTTPSARSPVSRPPGTRPACARCFPGSGSPRRSSPICAP
jgi:arginine decarboxylase